MRGLEKAFISPLGGAADVSRCVKAGADVNARDSIGNTSLHKAARYPKSQTPPPTKRVNEERFRQGER